MIPLIQQAMVMGYTATQIINFIANKIPNMSGGLRNAKKRGYSDEDILKFLSNKIPMKDPEGAKKYSNQLDDYLSSQGIKTKEERREQKAKSIKGALGLAGTALGAYKAYQTYSGIGQQLMGYLGLASGAGQNPNIGPTGSPPATPPGSPAPNPAQQVQATAQAPVQQAFQHQPAPGVVPGGISPQTMPQPAQVLPKTQVQQPAQPSQAPQTPTTPASSKPQVDSESILNQMGLTERIRSLTKAGNTPEGVTAALSITMSPGQKKWLSDQIKQGTSVPLEDLVSDYMAKIPADDKSQQKIARGSAVITPEGDIATIEDLPGKTAKVDINGKKEVFEKDELIPEPENKDEILDLYERLIAAIPEEFRSSVLNWVGYDSERNLLQLKFHDGKSYTYENIPPQFVKDLKDVSFVAKTNGGNYYGTFSKDDPSRGAGVFELLRNLQKSLGGKGNEYIAKFEEIYSYFGLPEQKLREKSKMIKEAEKEQKENLKREQEEKKKKRRKGNP